MTLAGVVSPRFHAEPPELLRAREILFAQAETRLGRPLHAAERNMDIIGIDRALEAGKARLAEAIRLEQRRVIKSTVYRNPSRTHLAVTPEMTAALVALHAAGRKHALAELAALGVSPRRSYAETPPSLDHLLAALDGRLGLISRRTSVEAGAVGVKVHAGDLGSISRAGIARAIEAQAPGALDAASRLVSGAFDAGRGDVFDLNSDLIGSWVYTAVMDDATCDQCSALDATEYPSWDAIQEVLPNGGPNPSCYGEGRCRCMAIPSSVRGSTARP